MYNGGSELTNWYHKADIGYLIRPYEIGVVFYIADTDWAITSLPAITPSALAADTDLWGTLVSSIQSDITVTGDKITGTLYPVTSGALPAKWGEGYFIALQFSASSWTPYTSVKVGMDPSEGSGLQELINDPDKAGVFKVTDKEIQLIAVLGTDGKDVLYRTYDISGLTLSATPPNSEAKKSKK